VARELERETNQEFGAATVMRLSEANTVTSPTIGVKMTERKK